MSRRPANHTHALCPLLPLLLALAGAGIAVGEGEECFDCHANPAAEGSPPQVETELAEQSVHNTVECVGCHVESEQRPQADSPSPSEQVERCGACHEEAQRAYVDSIHGKATADGNDEAPVCTTCHAEHKLAVRADSAAERAVQSWTRACAECHKEPAVLGAAGRKPDKTYTPSYHGLKIRDGRTEATNCRSCHGNHAVLRLANPQSTVHAGNLASTCGGCHDDATRFAQHKVHNASGLGKVKSWLSRMRVFYPIANRSLNPVVIAGLGGIVGLLSGIFGVGGGFLLTPLLIMIGIPPAVAAATDSAQITAGASSGAFGHYRHGNVDAKMGLLILVGGILGGTVGVRVVKVLRELGNFDFALKVVYVIILGALGTLMLVEGLKTLRGRKAAEETGQTPPDQQERSRLHRFFERLPLQTRFARCGIETSALLPSGAGFAVGLLAAFLGVGGGFIMIPAMIYLIGMPTHVAIGTDLFQITLVCANVTLQQAIQNHTVDLLLAVTLFAGSVLGAQVGVRLGQRLPGEQIRALLGVIVLCVMVMLAYTLVTTPDNLIALAKQAGGGH